MTPSLRAVGLPLGPEAARLRTRQIGALTDPVALRALSVIAATPDRGYPPARLADALALP